MIDVRNIKHHFSSGTYVREMTLPKGYEVLTHSHNYDHLSILSQGTALVYIGDIATEYHAGDIVEIKAHIIHKIIAIEDITWFCIHATEETDISKIDDVMSGKS